MIAPSTQRSSQSGSPIDVQLLFAEARRRRRRIRVNACLVVLVLAGTVAGLMARWHHHEAVLHPVIAARPAVADTKPPAARVGWVDYNGRLHIGSLDTGRQRVLTAAESNPVVPLVSVAGHIYWVNSGGSFWQIESLDLATARVRNLGFGMAVFAAPDGRHVFIAQTGAALIELSAAGDQSRSLNLPAGWFLAGLNNDFTAPAAVVGGILVQHSDSSSASRSTTLAIWNPADGRLTPILSGISASGGLLGTATPPGAHYSLVAWWHASCFPGSCNVEVTNTATRITRTIRSPLGHGFAYGLTFSPDGSELGAFVNTQGPSLNPGSAELAIISTRAGTARLVPQVSLLMGEDIAWVRWLPGGRVLLTGGSRFSGLVDAKTLAVRPFYFVHGHDHYIEDSQDLNYSAVILAGR